MGQGARASVNLLSPLSETFRQHRSEARSPETAVGEGSDSLGVSILRGSSDGSPAGREDRRGGDPSETM
jgi:hypothetical protein